MTGGRSRDLCFLFCLLLLIYNSNCRAIPAPDTEPASLLPFSLLREGDLDLDEFALWKPDPSSPASSAFTVLPEHAWQEVPAVSEGWLAAFEQPDGRVQFFVRDRNGTIKPVQFPYFVQYRHGHVLSSYPVVLPLVLTPLYCPLMWIPQVHDLSFLNPYTKRKAFKVARIMEKLSASLIATLSALVVYLALCELCDRRAALWVALLYALGTNTWTIGSQALWQHGFSELCLSVMVYALLKGRIQQGWLSVAGLGAALATANRPPNIVFLLLATLYVWQQYRWRGLSFLLAPVLIGVLQFTYNLAYFGALTGGYRILLLGTEPLVQRIVSLPTEGLLGILVSPNRGLFIYTPFVLFSFWGLGRVWRSRAFPLLSYMGVGILAQIWLYGQFKVWWGGGSFGPRFLTDILPLLCLLLVPILPELKRPVVRGLFMVAAVFSVGVQITGAFYYTGAWNTSPVNVDRYPERLWDWRDTQIRRSLQSGPAPTMFPFVKNFVQSELLSSKRRENGDVGQRR